MKYDSGMTSFHGTILSAVKYVFGRDEEIPQKFSLSDGSPAPLREFIKKKYGSSHTGGSLSDPKLEIYNCSPTKGLEIEFASALYEDNNDKELQLSWSQVAKFIRDNWNEIFNAEEPKSSVLEVFVRTFNEDEITCPHWIKGSTLKYLEVVNGIHFECKKHEMEFCESGTIIDFLNTHCNCPEKCSYCDNVPEQKKPSYLDIVRQHYPQMADNKIDEFKNSECVEHFFNSDTLCDCTKNGVECPDCWDQECAGEFEETEWNNQDEMKYYCVDDSDNSASYLDVVRQRYPEIADSKIDEFVVDNCIAEFFNHDNKDCDNKCQECWDKKCERKFIDCSFPNSLKKLYSDNESALEDKSSDNQIVPQDASAVPAVFDYSQLNSEDMEVISGYRDRHIQRQQKYYLDEAKDFADIRQRLAKYKVGIFDAWIKSEVDYSRTQVYRLIDLHDHLSQLGQMEQEVFKSLPKMLQYDISQKSAPPELTEKVMSGDITNHDDYIKLKKELERTEGSLRDVERNCNKLRDDYEELGEANADLALRLHESNDKNTALEKRIQELESRPIDVVMQPDKEALAEVERLKNELSEARQKIMDLSFNYNAPSTNTELVNEFYETLHGSVLSALRDCSDFLQKAPAENIARLKSRFSSLAEVVKDYINELEGA